MPLYYTSPKVDTQYNETQPEPQPDPLANNLQAQLQAYQVAECQPVIMRTRNIDAPDIVYNRGYQQWYRPAFARMVVFQPMSAPDIRISSPQFTEGLQRASSPASRRPVTGVHSAFRSPNINEGLL